MYILGIESSCDETAAAVIDDQGRIVSNCISSQMETHKRYGGVVPEIASREHLKNILPVIRKALAHADVQLSDIGKIAVTQGPGLVGCLLVGINTAKSIAYANRLPLAGVNHLEGHLLAPLLEHRVPFPHIGLVVSGGHTNLYLVETIGTYRLLGRTRDDAAGEAFDKTAKFLGLGYPGGVVIDRLAQKGNPHAVAFPRPMLHDGSYDFSFSGLKTAVINHVRKQHPDRVPDPAFADISASFQDAVVDILVDKTFRAALHHRVTAVTVGGGVAANSRLREKFKSKGAESNITVYMPSNILCTDNAAMIAYAGMHKQVDDKPFPFEMNAISRMSI